MGATARGKTDETEAGHTSVIRAEVISKSDEAYNHFMAIQSTTFGCIELSGKEAKWLPRHMIEDKLNLAAKASLAHGQAVLARIASVYSRP
ncbi:hypothetical protein [Acidiferrobacter thiooxydans]|uniref:hypothetical protein n=1 Tax=Acidiferrobacter thiooxydans TaxID=163359 RepID=UPI001146FA97|nr:hypothetical protein [Acidiferrobacter thiooxydans]UEN98929.1 hypothetical protein A9R16_010880 [Acidiferrobacter thiooxydans]